MSSPGAVQFLSDGAPPQQWRPTPDLVFTWMAATHDLSAIVGYYWIVDQISGSQAIGSWASTTDTEVSATITSPGTWYFHVAARNAAGLFGPTSTLLVNYNPPSGAPGLATMTLNGDDTVGGTPFLSAVPGGGSTFEWDGATDPDGDTLTYDVQFAQSSDFGDGDGVNVVREFTNLTSTSLFLAQPVGTGVWFWRIRAWDGVQFGEWSPKGSFEHNTPPGPPLGLRVSNS